MDVDGHLSARTPLHVVLVSFRLYSIHHHHYFCKFIFISIAVSLTTPHHTKLTPLHRWAIRNEAFQHVFLGTAGAFFLRYLMGTPMLPNMMRLFGLKIGSGCYLGGLVRLRFWVLGRGCSCFIFFSFPNTHPSSYPPPLTPTPNTHPSSSPSSPLLPTGTIDIPEFDVVEIGDNCVINAQVGIQTHLYEDRICKIGAIKIGNFVNIGTGSTILYDTVLKSGCHIGPQSCVMKGEVVNRDSYCVGIPTRSVPVVARAGQGQEQGQGQVAIEMSTIHSTTSPIHTQEDDIPLPSPRLVPLPSPRIVPGPSPRLVPG